jgi:hypothetical protein
MELANAYGVYPTLAALPTLMQLANACGVLRSVNVACWLSQQMNVVH